jgi:hypothetical protein
MTLLKDPERYKAVDLSNSQPKTRDARNLPKDGARLSFRSHNAHLENYDKTKSDEKEKAIVSARRQNLRVAEKLYIER